MGSISLLVIISVAAFVCSSSESPEQSASTCSKPWFVWKNDSCKCGSTLGGTVTCKDDPEDEYVYIETCLCMTVDSHTGETVVGACPYSCAVAGVWYPNGSLLNYHMCTETWNRQGRLCSQCIDGHGPPVYSYSMQCIPCSPEVVRDSIVYFLVSFLPLTVFCLVIITLRISGARPPMSTFILVSQVMSAPQYLSLKFIPGHYSSSQNVSNSTRNLCWKIFASFFGLSNLDFFRSFYPQMCLSPKMSLMHVKFLEYLIALFPLTVLVLVYMCVKYNHSRRIPCVCRVIHRGLTRLRQTIDIQTSLIDAFATFILLSVTKTGYTSFTLLQLLYVLTPYGNFTKQTYVDPMSTYFGWDHLPYALTALVLTFLLILIPLLLLFLYPLRSFQTFLNNRQWQCTTLHIFADSFQGCYKDGTNGTRDYRWFAGLHLLLRFLLVILIKFTQQRVTIISVSFYMVMLAVCQPYKKHLHFKLDMFLLFGLLLWSIALIRESEPGDSEFKFHLSILILATLIPSVYFIGLVIYWVIVLKKLHSRIKRKILDMFRHSDQILLNSSA